MKHYDSTITQRGQVTLPAEVRRILGVKPREKVTFEVEEGQVRVVPARFTLESASGSVPALKRPLSLEEITHLAAEEHARHVLAEMCDTDAVH